MIWLDFKNAVKVDLPADNERIGIATGTPNYLDQQILYAAIEIQKIVPFYQAGHETVYGPDDLVIEGFASVGNLPVGQQCRPIDAYYKKTGRQCVSQPLRTYPWGNRYDLICGNPRIIGSQFLIAIDPWGGQFTVFPSVALRRQVSLTWNGVKTLFNDIDDTPFDMDVVEAVGLFAKAKIARAVDHDLNEYASYMTEYGRKRSVLFADTRDRTRMSQTADSPSSSNKCANSVAPCQDAGAGCGTTNIEHEDTVEFIAFGDSGDLTDMTNTNAVANLVKSLEPGFIMHLGDCTYPVGDPVTIQDILIKPYGLFIPNTFFLAFGNHDIITDGGAALAALLTAQATFNAGAHYYDFIPQNKFGQGFAHIFVLDSYGDPAAQWAWLQPRLAASDLWNIVVMHEPPYTSDINHAPGNVNFRFDYKDAGAHIVLSGHGHNYERLLVNGFPYLVAGTGGNSLRGFTPVPTTGSQFRYNTFFGCLYVTARPHQLQLTFYDTKGDVIDSLALQRQAVNPFP
jgi:tartrate-resistant acid phosphatase type 5